ncbi:MAG: DedA family protein [Phycisphaerales bacterium]|nr:MAG: DedA family protein [Phycisphaerales bacterium]
MTDSETANPEVSCEAQMTRAQATSGEEVAWWHWHRRLYDWVIHFAHTKHGTTALFCLSFAESSFFPVPPDVLLGPLALGAPKKWLKFALACAIASVLGGILGYCIGMFLWSMIGDWVITHLTWAGLTEANFAKFQNAYRKWDFLVVFTCGFTPLPYKVCTISAGIAEINFFGFLIASTVSRSARFFIVAGLMGWKGEKIRPLVEKYFNWFSLAFVVLLIGGFLVIKWIH